MTLCFEVDMALPNGRILTLKIDAPVAVSTGAEPGQMGAPVASFAPYLKDGEGNRGKSAPVAPPAVAGATLFPSPTAGRLGRNTAGTGQVISLAEELKQGRGALAAKSFDLAMLDRELSPGRDEERAIKDRLQRSYAVNEAGVIVIDFVRRNERAPLFRALDELTRTWGPKRVERSRIAGEVKALEKLVEHLTKQSKRDSAPKQRKA